MCVRAWGEKEEKEREAEREREKGARVMSPRQTSPLLRAARLGRPARARRGAALSPACAPIGESRHAETRPTTAAAARTLR